MNVKLPNTVTVCIACFEFYIYTYSFFITKKTKIQALYFHPGLSKFMLTVSPVTAHSCLTSLEVRPTSTGRSSTCVRGPAWSIQPTSDAGRGGAITSRPRLMWAEAVTQPKNAPTSSSSTRHEHNTAPPPRVALVTAAAHFSRQN
jgi:hypothetical protein